MARLIGQFLSEKLGQQFIIENKVGAGGNIGMAAVLSAPPDGYTIGYVAPNNAINASLYEKLPFDFVHHRIKFRPPDLIDFAMTPNRRLSAVRCQET